MPPDQQINQLIYLAKPRPRESSRGILMRTAHYNGYDTVERMCCIFGIGLAHRRSQELLTVDSALLDLFKNFAPLESDFFSSSFYSLPSRLSDYSNGIGEFFTSPGSYDKAMRYCPQCIEDDFLDFTIDVRVIDHCPIHRLPLVRECPSCKGVTPWYSTNLLACSLCGHHRGRESTTQRPYSDIHSGEVFGYGSKIHKLIEVHRAHLVHDKLSCATSDRHLILAPLSENSIHKLIDAQVSQYPELPKEIHLAPWLACDAPPISILNDRFSDYTASACEPECHCVNLALTQDEIKKALGIPKSNSLSGHPAWFFLTKISAPPKKGLLLKNRYTATPCWCVLLSNRDDLSTLNPACLSSSSPPNRFTPRSISYSEHCLGAGLHISASEVSWLFNISVSTVPALMRLMGIQCSSIRRHAKRYIRESFILKSIEFGVIRHVGGNRYKASWPNTFSHRTFTMAKAAEVLQISLAELQILLKSKFTPTLLTPPKARRISNLRVCLLKCYLTSPHKKS